MPPAPKVPAHPGPAPWRTLRATPALLRLLWVRYATQGGDGAFQVALGGAILFNPEREANPAAIAAGFAVLLIPYSLVGPFAGALLDRWDRRRVLTIASAARAAIVVSVAIALWAGASTAVLLALALAATGISRFVLSGLSACLPHVASYEQIPALGSILTTTGSLAAAGGGGLALGLRLIVGDGDQGAAILCLISVAGSLLAAAIVLGYPVGELGPDGEDSPAGSSSLRAVATGLMHGVEAVRRSPTVLATLIAVGAHRIAFGMTMMCWLVMANYEAEGDGAAGSGIGSLSALAGLVAAGIAVAALIVPGLVRRFGRRATVAGGLITCIGAQLAVASPWGPTPLPGAFALGMAGQVCKLCADAAMAQDIDDRHRGHVFSFQDAVFNIAFVGSLALASAVVAPDGHSLALGLTAAGVYLLGLLASLAASRGEGFGRAQHHPPVPVSGHSPAGASAAGGSAAATTGAVPAPRPDAPAALAPGGAP